MIPTAAHPMWSRPFPGSLPHVLTAVSPNPQSAIRNPAPLSLSLRGGDPSSDFRYNPPTHQTMWSTDQSDADTRLPRTPRIAARRCRITTDGPNRPGIFPLPRRL